MKWLLIVLLFGSAGEPAVATVEFNDKLTCEIAATAVRVRSPFTVKNETFCMEVAK